MRTPLSFEPVSRTTATSLLYPLAVAAGLFAAAPVAAEPYSARTVGDWTLAPSEDGQGCFLTRQYDGAGDTTLLLGLDIDGANHLSVLNDNWSIKPKARLALDFRLSNGGYTDHGAVGMASNGKKGFVTSFESKFPGYFATSEALYITRETVPVARLSLAGSGAAVVELRQCVEAQRATAKAGVKATAKGQGKAGSDTKAGKTKHGEPIPKDPFAPGATRHAKR